MIELKHTEEVGDIRQRLYSLEQRMADLEDMPNRLKKAVDALKREGSYPTSGEPPKTCVRASVSD